MQSSVMSEIKDRGHFEQVLLLPAQFWFFLESKLQSMLLCGIQRSFFSNIDPEARCIFQTFIDALSFCVKIAPSQRGKIGGCRKMEQLQHCA